jgi:hypothetical protein
MAQRRSSLQTGLKPGPGRRRVLARPFPGLGTDSKPTLQRIVKAASGARPVTMTPQGVQLKTGDVEMFVDDTFKPAASFLLGHWSMGTLVQ